MIVNLDRLRDTCFMNYRVAGGIVGIFLLTIVGLQNYKQRDTYRCSRCHAAKHDFQWRVGQWSGLSLPLTPKWEQIEDTDFGHEFLDTEHSHVWEYAQGSPYYLFGTRWGGCAIGKGRHISTWFSFYSQHPDFRAFIKAEVVKGKVSRQDIINWFSEPATGDDAFQKRMEAVFDGYLDGRSGN